MEGAVRDFRPAFAGMHGPKPIHHMMVIADLKGVAVADLPADVFAIDHYECNRYFAWIEWLAGELAAGRCLRDLAGQVRSPLSG